MSVLKTTRVIVLAAFCLMGCTSNTTPSHPEATPTTATKCPSEAWTTTKTIDFGQSTISTMFRDDSFGITTDLAGEIYYTEDGGETWHNPTQAGFSRVALEMEGDMVWHIGYGGAVMHSTDSGHTWTHVGTVPHNQHVEYISFADEQVGWVVTTEESDFFVTDDGARTWRRLPLPPGMQAPTALHLQTSSAGYLLDVAGNLFITNDGGQTWAMRSLGLEEGWAIPRLNHSAAIRFVDAEHGLIALNLIGQGQGWTLALRTEDGGATWREEPLPVPMGMFHLTRDGVYLTHVDLLDHAKFTLLCASPPD